MPIDYWSRKIMALLHDPLDKILRKNHEKFAADIARRILTGDNDIIQEIAKKIEKHHSEQNEIALADRNASAINRGLIIRGTETHDIYIQNPFSAYLRILGVKAWRLETPINVEKKYSLDKKGFLDLFRDLFGIYYKGLNPSNKEITRNLLLLSEDTRTPASPMFPHLQMTSALVNSFLNGKPEFYFLMVDIGGVQEFISNARKTKDFWASSYLVSLLSFSVLRKIIEEFGPDQIIIPWTLFIPLVDLVIYGKYDNEIKSKLKSPLVPNTITAIIPKYVDEKEYSPSDIKDMIKKALRDFWKLVIEEFENYLQELSISFNRKRLERHLRFDAIFSKIRISVVEYDKMRKSNLLKKIDKEKCFNKIKEIPDKDGILEYPHQILENFESYMDLLGKINSSKKYQENYKFEPTPSNDETKKRCTMCGIRESIPDEIIEVLRKKHLIDQDENLCYLDLLKRVFYEIFGKILKRLSNVRSLSEKLKWVVPSTTDLGTIWFRASLLAFVSAVIQLRRDGELKDDTFWEIKENLKNMIKNLSDYKNEVKNLIKGLKNNNETDVTDQTFVYRDNNLIYTIYKEIKNSTERILEINLKDFLEYPSELLLESEIKPILSRAGISDQTKIKKIQEEYNKKVRQGFFNIFREMIKNNKENIAKKAIEILNKYIIKLLKFEGNENIINVLTIKDSLSTLLPLAVEPQNRFCLIRADGDDMGKWIMGEKFAPWILYFLPEHRSTILDTNELMMNCNGGKIILRSRPISPSILSTLSMVISFQALIIQDIVEAFGGFLIYSGGDDVLALVPPEIWHIVYQLIRFTFSREYSLLKSLKAFPEGINIYGLGWRATMSFGIVLANHKADLRWIIDLSRTLEEDNSKELMRRLENGECLVLKDALTVALTSRSSILKKAGPMPNILLKRENKIYTIKEFERNLLDKIRKLSVKEESKNYNIMIAKMVESGPFLKVLAKGGVFAGIRPKNKFDDSFEIYTPLEQAYTLLEEVRFRGLSIGFLHSLMDFYNHAWQGNFEDGEILLLEYNLKRKIPKEYPIKELKNFLKAIEKYGKTKYSVRGKCKTLLEFIPLSIIFERILRNSILVRGDDIG